MASQEACEYVEQCCAILSAPPSHEALQQATQDLLKFKASSAPYHTCFLILERKSSPAALYHAITTMRAALSREYGSSLSEQETHALCSKLLQYAGDNIANISEFLTASICRILATAQLLTFPTPSPQVLKWVLQHPTTFGKADDEELQRISTQTSPEVSHYIVSVRTFLYKLAADIMALFESSNPLHVQLGCVYISTLLSEVALPSLSLFDTSHKSQVPNNNQDESSSSSSSSSYALLASSPNLLGRVIFHIVAQNLLNPFFTQLIMHNIERMLGWLKTNPHATIFNAVNTHGLPQVVNHLTTGTIADVFKSPDTSAGLQLLSLLLHCLVTIFDWNWLDGDVSRVIDMLIATQDKSGDESQSGTDGGSSEGKNDHSRSGRHHDDVDDSSSLSTNHTVILGEEWRPIFVGSDEYLRHDSNSNPDTSYRESSLPSIVMLRNVLSPPQLSTIPSTQPAAIQAFTLVNLLQQSAVAPLSQGGARPVSRLVFDLYSLLLQCTHPSYLHQTTFKYSVESTAFSPESNAASLAMVNQILLGARALRSGVQLLSTCFRHLRTIVSLLFQFKGDCFGDAIDATLHQLYHQSSSSSSATVSLGGPHYSQDVSSGTSLGRVNSLDEVEKTRSVTTSSAIYRVNDQMKCNIHYRHHVHRLVLCMILAVGDFISFIQLHYKQQQLLFLQSAVRTGGPQHSGSSVAHHHPDISFDEPDSWILHAGHDAHNMMLSAIQLVGISYLLQLPVFSPLLGVVQPPQATTIAPLFMNVTDWDYIQSLMYTTLRFYTDVRIQQSASECLHYGHTAKYEYQVISIQPPPLQQAQGNGHSLSLTPIPTQLQLQWGVGVPLILARVLLGCLYPNLHLSALPMYNQFSPFTSGQSPQTPMFLTSEQTEAYSAMYSTIHMSSMDQHYTLTPSLSNTGGAAPLYLCQPYTMANPLSIQTRFALDISSVSFSFLPAQTLTYEQRECITVQEYTWHQLICSQYTTHISWSADSIEMLLDIWQLLASYSTNLTETYGQQYLAACSPHDGNTIPHLQKLFPIKSIGEYKSRLGELCVQINQTTPHCLPPHVCSVFQAAQEDHDYFLAFPLVSSRQPSTSLSDPMPSPWCSQTAVTLVGGIQLYLQLAAYYYYNAMLITSFDDAIYTAPAIYRLHPPNTAITPADDDDDDDYNSDDDHELQDVLDDQYSVDTFHRIATILRSHLPTSIGLLSQSLNLHITQLQQNHTYYHETPQGQGASPHEVMHFETQRDVCLELLVNLFKMAQNILCDAFTGEKPTPSTIYLIFSLIVFHNNTTENTVPPLLFRLPDIIFHFSHQYHQLLVAAFKQPSQRQPFTSTKSTCLSTRASQHLLQFSIVYIQSYFNIPQLGHALSFYHPQLSQIFSPQNQSFATYTQLSLVVTETILSLWSEEQSICLTACAALKALLQIPQMCSFIIQHQPQHLQSLVALFTLAALSSPILAPFISNMLSPDTLPLVIKDIIQLHLPLCKQFQDIYTLNRFTDAVFASFTSVLGHILSIPHHIQRQQDGYEVIVQRVEESYKQIMSVLEMRVQYISQASITVYGTELGGHILTTDFDYFQQTVRYYSPEESHQQQQPSPPVVPTYPSLLSKVSATQYQQQKHQVIHLIRGNFTIISAILNTNPSADAAQFYLFDHTLALIMALPIYEDEWKSNSSQPQQSPSPLTIDAEVYETHQFVCSCIDGILESSLSQLSLLSVLLLSGSILRYVMALSSSHHEVLLRFEPSSTRGDGSEDADDQDGQAGGQSLLAMHTINFNDTTDVSTSTSPHPSSHLCAMVLSILQHIMHRIQLPLHDTVDQATLQQANIAVPQAMALLDVSPSQTPGVCSLQGNSAQFHLILAFVYRNLSQSIPPDFLIRHYNILETFFYSVPSLFRISFRALILTSPHFTSTQCIAPADISGIDRQGIKGVGSSPLVDYFLVPFYDMLRWGLFTSYDDIIRVVYSSIHQLACIHIDYLRHLSVYASGGRPKGETRKVLDNISRSVVQVYRVDPAAQSGLYLPPPLTGNAGTSPPPTITIYGNNVQINSMNSYLMLFYAQPDLWVYASPLTGLLFKYLHMTLEHFLLHPLSPSILHNECADALYTLLIAICGCDDLHSIVAASQHRITHEKLSQEIPLEQLAQLQQQHPTSSQLAAPKGLANGLNALQASVSHLQQAPDTHARNHQAMLDIIQQLLNNAVPLTSQAVNVLGVQVPTAYPYSIALSDSRLRRNAFKGLLKDVHSQARLTFT